MLGMKLAGWGVETIREKPLAYRAGRIDNFHSIVITLVPNRGAESVLDGRVVAVDEMVLAELDCERRFTWDPSISPREPVLSTCTPAKRNPFD